MEINRKAALRVVADERISRPSEITQRERTHDAATSGVAPPERWQHGQDSAPHADLRTAQRVSSGVQRLRDAGDIGDAEMMAAERWWQDYAEGVEGVRDPGRGGSGGASDPHVTQLIRARAIGRHRDVSEVLGQGMTIRLIAFLVDELSLTAMAERFMPGKSGGNKRMATQMATLLTMLAGLYASIDRKGRR